MNVECGVGHIVVWGIAASTFLGYNSPNGGVVGVDVKAEGIDTCMAVPWVLWMGVGCTRRYPINDVTMLKDPVVSVFRCVDSVGG